MVSAHFENVPIISLTTGLTPLNDQPGFKFDIKRYTYKAVLGIIYTDALSTMYHATVPREINKGDALELANHYLTLLDDGTMPLDKKSVLDTMQEAVNAFNNVKTNGRDYPRVGLVGEIYVKYNEFGNNQVVQWLIEQDLEVVMPPLMEFFAVWPTNAQNSVRWGLKKPDLMWLLSFVVEKYVQSFLNNAEEVLKSFKIYQPWHTINDIAAKAREIVNLTHQYGEGWLIPGEVGTFVKSGVPNVLCLQPFGCIANHVVAKGVEKRMKLKYPNLNLLFLDADAGVSEVNYFNRLHFFANQAKTTMV
jgi:predicted nucleotide-binding protein (sugar kinase/HSP70/actin superfamily)